MRLLMVAFLMASPGVFAQARGGGGRVGGGVRGPVRVAPAPAARPVGPAVVPYPVFFAGYYPNPFYGGYAAAPVPPAADYGPAPAYYGADPTGGQGYPAPEGYPSVIVNPNYTPEVAHPVLRDYSNLPTPDAAPPQGNDSPAAPSVIFLIAMTDHTIYPAIAYWVEDDTLNYVTQQGVRNRVSLDLVDRAFSTQLNKERSVDFALPPAK